MSEALHISTFVADITPPVGQPLEWAMHRPAGPICTPLLAKGVILHAVDGPCVLCAVDWLSLSNEAYELFRNGIAEAAGADPARVAVQTVHQHTAPMEDPAVYRILHEKMPAQGGQGLDFLSASARKVASAVSGAKAHSRRVTHIGTSWAAVDRVASSRRIRQPDHTILARASRPEDPALHKAPEGRIDGFLRTVSFFEGDTPLVHMHYYAMHPQVNFTDGRVTYDVPGIARERLQDETGVFQVYFTGCGGDITMGKYNDGSDESRQALAGRLYDGMVRSVQGSARTPVPTLGWRTTGITFPIRKEQAFSEENCRETLKRKDLPFIEHFRAATGLVLRQRVKKGGPFPASCLSLGSVRILNLPGEPFVEYQLWAQQQYPDLFVAVAGYGDCGVYWYICTDQAYRDVGGYEQTDTLIGPCEQMMKQSIASLIEE